MTMMFICPIHGLTNALPAAGERVIINPETGKEEKKKYDGYKCAAEGCMVFRLEGELEYPND